MTPGETFRCTPVDPRLSNISLVVKRAEIPDRRTFDEAVYELDVLKRFRDNPNIVSLFSYWTEPSEQPYRYKTLCSLYEEGTMGDMLHSVVLSPARPSERIIMKWAADFSKGLGAFHAASIVHGGVRAANIFLNQTN